VGTVWLGISSINIALILVNKWIYQEEVEGWTSIMASIWLIGGVVIFLLGVIGIYLSRVFVETKNRPIAVVRKVYKKETP
jgi:putative glycosyltransferase